MGMRIAWRVGAVGAVVVAIAAAVLVVAARHSARDGGDRTQPHVTASSAATVALDQPYQTGVGFQCPDGLPVRAFADGTSYPPGHPAGPPPVRRPVRCYATAAQAAAAGYREGPLPPGALERGGVYLAPVAAGLLGRCRQAASRLGFAVIRPGFCGGSIAWKAGWSHGIQQQSPPLAEALPARAA